MMLASCFLVNITISIVLFLTIFSLSQKFMADTEKKSPFECGFTPKANSRFFFSLQFFLITLIFLIFDVELVLMFPVLTELAEMAGYSSSASLLIFLMMLSLGLLWEWNQAILEWAA